jgi:alkanesulfonate monooxygenase SsuD/methylene tetrahydromethanopterin reductase-like flavin-dependent oxidoreductase (luciferase family)
VWSVIGGLSQVTSLPVTTGVTCPTMRTHPAIIAQAAATSNVMLDGRFSLGIGTGERLVITQGPGLGNIPPPKASPVPRCVAARSAACQ